jgi:uncharacterized protein YkwD
MKKLLLLLAVATAGCFLSVFATDRIIVLSEGFEGRLATLHNNHRASIGVPHLILNSELSDFAAKHSEKMAKQMKLKHSDLGFEGNYRGENIAMTTHEDESLVMKNWLRSTLHKNNLESIFYQKIGIGRSRSRDGYYYWTIVFNGS